MPDEMKQPEECVFWRCDGMSSPFLTDHQRKKDEIGQCMPRKMPCELETNNKHGCGMFLSRHPRCQTDGDAK